MTKPLLYNYPIDEEQEKKDILREYRSLLRLLKPRLKKDQKRLVRRAFEMAADAHREMRRKSGEPYIMHPLAVAKIAVEEIGLGVTSACCALLHDVVEDTEISLEDIESEFGSTYARIIDGLTKISNVVDIKAVVSMQAENFRKILLTLAEDPRVILIKLADRLHNMRTLGSMSHEKRLKIASETSFIYAPLAHRLGLYEIKTELEDLSLKTRRPDVYLDIRRQLKETKRGRTRYINEFIKPIKEVLESNGFDFKIFGRPKSISSILHKMRTKRIEFNEVFDLFAIRIILNSKGDKGKEDCWKVYSVITNFYRPNPDRLRDWISVPKGNGYEALHTTVMGAEGRWVEVQIRTERMNEIAEKGLAAHWKYKEGEIHESKIDEWLKHISDILNTPDVDTLDFVQDFKMDLFYKEIYVYTPKGDMKVMPQGATALDLAFEIHSELGARCIGAKVNYRLVPISQQLKSGDQVEIITSDKQKPSEDWLRFVVTGKAKSRIKYYLNEERRRVAQDGEAQLYHKFEAMKIKPSTENIQELCNYFKVDSPLDLYYGLAVGNFDLKMLTDATLVGERLRLMQKEKVNGNTTLKELKKLSDTKNSELVIFGESSDKIFYTLAACCQPIPGDDVFGFVTSGGGIKIHRTDCPNAPQLMANFAHRIVKTKWAKNKEISFLTGIKLTGLDDVGIIQNITNVLTGELKLNMRSISIDSKDGVFEGTIKAFVHDLEELDELCRRLQQLDGIDKVERIESDED